MVNEIADWCRCSAVSRALLIVGLVTAAVAGAQQPAAFAVPASAPQPPWVGTWQLEEPQAASRFEPPPYKKTTTRIEPWEDGLKVTYDLVRTRGGITHMEWIGRFDGKDYPVQGVDNYLTNAYRLIDDRRYEIVIKVDHQTVARATAVVAPDGATLSVTTEQNDERGLPVKTTAVYRRR